MFNIKAWLKYFIKRKDIAAPKISTLSEDQDIVIVSLILDCQSQKIVSFLDIKPYDMSDARMLNQAEAIGTLLSRLCDHSVELTQNILSNIEDMKKDSNETLLFLNNVLFFWKNALDLMKTNNQNIPLIKPTQVFKHSS
jgi:hypothetical protein